MEKRIFVASNCEDRKKEICTALENCDYCETTDDWEKCELIVIDLCGCSLYDFKIYFANKRHSISVTNSIFYPPVIFLDQCKNNCERKRKEEEINRIKSEILGTVGGHNLIPFITNDVKNLEQFTKWLDYFVPRTKSIELTDEEYGIVTKFVGNQV